jgi:hypothetical protein
MVIFDVLVSHFRMSRWHEERIAQHLAQAAALQEARGELEQRRAAGGGPSTPASPSRAEVGTHNVGCTFCIRHVWGSLGIV